ncbi:unnamed protein product [Blepharisma stoltei]|uniref:Uncharacterized protein n=1 Tax=Blepharisma stoltei TaxID=1481888 RepID=A0AAU9JST6_9CILI|nr:unnamed protein product [Blepharisma stoltei]
MKHLYHKISTVDDGARSTPIIQLQGDENILDFLFVKTPKIDTKKLKKISPSQTLSKKSSLKLLGINEINDFFKSDKEKNQRLMTRETPTRDVSHLKDKISLPSIEPKLIQSILPTNIKHLQKLAVNEELLGSSCPTSPGFLTPLPCRKEECNDYTLQTQRIKRSHRNNSCSIPDIYENEKLDLGNPAGRQDVENLKKWLQFMKDKIVGVNKNIEDISKCSQKELFLIYNICAKEIIRQVAVHCVERGEILKEVVDMLVKIKLLKISRMRESIKAVEENKRKELENELNKRIKITEDYEKKIEELNEIIVKKTNSKLRLKAKYDSLKKHNEILKKQTFDITEGARRGSLFNFGTLTPLLSKNLLSSAKSKRSSYRASSIGSATSEDECRSALIDESNISSITNAQANTPAMEIQVLKDPNLENEGEKQFQDASCQWNVFDVENISDNPNLDFPKPGPDGTFSDIEEEKSENLEIIDENEECDLDLMEEEKFYQLGMNEKDIMENNSDIAEISEINVERPLIESCISEQIITKKEYEEDERHKSYCCENIKHNETEKNEEESNSDIKRDNNLSRIIQQKQSKLNFITFLIKKKIIILKNLNREITEKKQQLQYSDMSDHVSMVLVNEKNISGLQSIFNQSGRQISASERSSISVSERNSFLSEELDESEQSYDTSSNQEEGKIDEFLQGDEKVPIKRSDAISTKPRERKLTKYHRKHENIIDEAKQSSGNQNYYNPLETNETETLSTGRTSDYSPFHINEPAKLDTNTSNEENTAENQYQIFSTSYTNVLEIPEITRTSKRIVTMFPGKITKQPTEEDLIIQKINTETLISSEEAKAQVIRNSNPRLTFHTKKEKSSTTKFKIFHFQRKETIMQKKVIHPAPALLEKFITRKMERIRKKSTMTRKMVHRLISSIYSACLAKVASGLYLDGLVEQTYDEFMQKYSYRKTSEKKFFEFISSLFNSIDSKRAVNFMRFIGAAKRIGITNFSKLSFVFYIQAYHSMISSNKGILVAYDDTAERAMIPKSRATEFLNTKMEGIIDKQTHSRLSVTIEQLTVPDPKKINTSGLVEIEAVLELFVEVHEEYQNKINQGLYMLVEAVRFNEDKTHLPFAEFLILARIISPSKYQSSKDDIKKWIDNFKDDEEINQLEEIFGKCVEKNLLSIGDVNSFYSPKEELNSENVLREMNSSKEIIMDIISKMRDTSEKKWVSLSEDEWVKKIDNCLESVTARNPVEAMLAWKIYKSELLRVYEIIEAK